MRLDRLSFTDYRNVTRLEMNMPPAGAVLIGDNAQGKSNILEAAYLLATMKAARAETDLQLIRRDTLDEVMPAARVVGEAQTQEGPLRLEITIMARPGRQGPVATKTVKMNGVARRLTAAVGRLTAVLFTSDDMDLVTGPPGLRRRLLDLTLTQVDSAYGAARQRFEKVLAQRNHLLRRIREGEARVDELPFWDESLGRDGTLIFQARAAAVRDLSRQATACHRSLAPGELLTAQYLPCLDGETAGLAEAEHDEVSRAYADALRRGLDRDIAAGMTLQGPHRDDVRLSLDGIPAAGYASRGQQRTLALALRLAEAQLLYERRGEPPVLLLDDILSEMDAARRGAVLSSVEGTNQMLITGTDWDRFPADFLPGASRLEVRDGSASMLGQGSGG